MNFNFGKFQTHNASVFIVKWRLQCMVLIANAQLNYASDNTYIQIHTTYTHKMCIVNSNADSAKLNCRPVTEFHIYYANVNINLLWWTTMYGMTGWRCWMLDAGCCWYYWCPIECRWFGWDAGMSTNLGLLFHDRLWWLASQCNDHRLYPPAFIVSTE